MDRHGHKKPIDFQTNKLPFAVGLTEPERLLLQEMRISQKQLPGTTETRRRIGQYLFGARVEYGDPLFITLTPTMRHNALYLKLSRYSAFDPCVQEGAAWHQKHAPRVWANNAA